MHLVLGGLSVNDDVTLAPDLVLDLGVRDLMHHVHIVSVSIVMLHSSLIMY